jgi:hypothetical protein
MDVGKIVDQQQIAVVSAVLADLCAATGLGQDALAYEDTARLLGHLYRNGRNTAERLRKALDPATLQDCFG